MRVFIRQSFWTVMFSLFSVALVAAQVTNCDGLYQDALDAVEANCDGTGRNEACYGYDQVSASFIGDVADDFFATPADRSEVADIETITTAALDLDTGIWGVALMNLQANIPNSIPGQNVTFILMGDVAVENAVESSDAFEPAEAIEITITAAAGANIRSGSGLNFNVIGGARPDETLQTDGTSVDGDWFRVAYNERVAWVSRSVIDDSIEGLDDLPTLTNDLRTPMQAFYLRSGIGQPTCEDIPDDLLLVQGPENIEVNITANGADIRIGSTVGLRTVEIDGELFLEVIAFAGEINFMGVTLRPGQRSRACLGDDENNRPTVVCDASPAENIPDFGEAWCEVEALPVSLMNYQIDILCPGEVPVTTTTSNNSGGATSSNIGDVNCSSFGIISPTGAVNSGNQTFNWSPATGDNVEYQLVFYNFEGTEVESFYTINTSYSVNLGAETSTGGSFSWEVRAYQNGTYACVTFRSQQLTRTGDLNPAVSSGVFSASLTNCGPNTVSFFYEGIISWSNAPGPVTVVYVDGSFGTPTTINSSMTTGNVLASVYYYGNIQSATVTSEGQTINLGGC